MGTDDSAATSAAKTDTALLTAQERRARRKEIMAGKRSQKRRRQGRLNAGANKAAKVTKTNDKKETASPSNEKKNPLATDRTTKPQAPSTITTAATGSSDNPPPSPTAVAELIKTEPKTVIIAEPTWHRHSTTNKDKSASSNAQEEPRVPLSTVQTKQVDDAFEQLFGYAWGTDLSSENKDISKKNYEESTAQRILSRMMGTTSVARILRFKTSGTIVANKAQSFYTAKLVKPAPTRIRTSMPVLTNTTIATATSTHASTVKPAQAQPKPATPATESTPANPTVTAKPAGGGGVDDLLKKMNETGKVSTIAKTANDWESFKTDTGLAASLEEHTVSKGAFLKKKDFLDRVDHRKFENERQERERERAKRK